LSPPLREETLENVREYSKKSRTNKNFDDFKLTEKKYKKVMDEAILAHRRKLSREINNLKSSNSQEFWKLLKKGKTREQPSIPINKLLEFFQTLTAKPDADHINIPFRCRYLFF
jgi:aspartate ammonia-lyase